MKIIQKIKNFIKHTPIYSILVLIKQKKYMRDWERRGRTGSPPPSIKQKIVKEYTRRFVIDTLIETGTYKGEMVSAIKNTFKEIFSID